MLAWIQSAHVYREDPALTNAGLAVLSERANHHPTFSVNPARTCETEGGCDVDVELSSYSEKVVTYADVALARRLNALGVQAQA